ncbi:kinase-like domain-containing protein [Bisporella sp. PMI_857]|nr:kinase-like domain-containing protein [Bisporella sp. PMI_857]
MAARTANYLSYLELLFPNTAWELEPLTGGLVNSTLRATRASGDAKYDSLIIKHARPYIEVAGPEWPFSTERQSVEATILELFSELGALYACRNSAPLWHTPQLIRHDRGKESTLKLNDSDQDASILLLADLGHLVNIIQFLKTVATTSGIATKDQIARIGSTVGQAFALIHSQATADTIREDHKITQVLTHCMAKDVVWKAAIEPLENRLHNRPNGRKVFDRVKEEWESPRYEYSKCLSIGDFTPGTLLLRSPQAGSDLTPIIADWEFAQINGHGVNGDIAQFLASMCCELINSKVDPIFHIMLSEFVSNFCRGYREVAKLQFKKSANDGNLQLLRSTFILSGREIINQAHDVYGKSDFFQDMVDQGVWYVEHAGADVEEFFEQRNWSEIVKEEGRLLQSLFIEK